MDRRLRRRSQAPLPPNKVLPEAEQAGDDTGPDASSDAIMNDAPAPQPTRSITKPIRFTPINQPWSRNLHNAALFDSAVPEGSYLTEHAAGPSRSSVKRKRRLDDDRDHDLADDELDTEDEDDDTPSPARPTKPAQSPLSYLFASPIETLRDDRLLLAASHHTNFEIIEQVRLHHPKLTTLPSKITNITQRLFDSVTRVAAARGVAREVVRAELDDARAANGVLARQAEYMRARRREATEARMARKVEGEGQGEVQEAGSRRRRSGRISGAGVMDGSRGKAKGKAKAKVNTPYGLGGGKARVVLDSEDEEEKDDDGELQ